MNKEVLTLTKNDILEYIKFIESVFFYTPDKKDIEKMLKEEKILVIKNESKIIASISLSLRQDYIKGKKYYYLNYFGVLKPYRRMGYATRIFEEVESLVKKNNINYIELTSGNQRKSAHYFYQKNLFKIKDSTVFIKIYE